MLHAHLVLHDDKRQETIQIDKLESFIDVLIDSAVSAVVGETGSVTFVMTREGFKKKVTDAKPKIRNKLIAELDRVIQERRDASMG